MAELKSITVAVDVEDVGAAVFRDSMRALASAKGSTAAKLVRRALEAQYGAELEPYYTFFRASRASRVAHMPQTGRKRTVAP